MYDPYLIPNTNVLQNKLEISDKELLEKAEADITYFNKIVQEENPLFFPSSNSTCQNQNNKPKTLSTMFPVDKVFLILQLNFFFILLRKKLFSNRHAF